MKALLQLVSPLVKALFYVVGAIVTVTLTSYYGIQNIAKSEATVMEEKIMAVRNADFQHINGRFDKTDEKLERIEVLIMELKR